MISRMSNPYTWPAPTGRPGGYRLIGGPADGRIASPGGWRYELPLTGDIYEYNATRRGEIVLIHEGRE